LPDFLAQHTKMGEYVYTKLPQNIPNGYSILQMTF
jgi:hypothetical protein